MNRAEKQKVVAFTDGSSRGNPGPGGWGAILVFPSDEEGREEVVEMGGGERKTTNNRMEMKAVIEALKHTVKYYSDRGEDTKPIVVYTDSGYLIKGITEWVNSWARNGWVKRGGGLVKNDDLWKELKTLTAQLSVSWQHVRGHTGVAGNERADEIACRFADGDGFPIKSYLYADYDIDVMSLEGSSHTAPSKNGNSRKSSARVYSYVSLVDGKALSHPSWGECKDRVSGVSGARFKKVYSRKEEAELKKEWSA